MKSVLCFLWMTIIVFTLASCNGGEGGEPGSSDGAYTAHQDKIYILGRISGALAEEIPKIFVSSTPYDGSSGDAPIIISADYLNSMSPSDWRGVLSAFINQYPVVLSNANQDQINALLVKLNLRFQHYLPEGDSYAEVFAVDLEPGGHTFVWSMTPPPPDNIALQNDSVDPLPTLTPAYQDNHGDQLTRTDNFRAWLALSQFRISAPLSSEMARAKQALASAASLATSTSSQNLLDFAQAYVQTQHYSLIGNNYQVSYYVYSCHAVNTTDGSNSDWFYVSQIGILNSGHNYSTARRKDPPELTYFEGSYARTYSMESFIPSSQTDWKTQPTSSGVILHATSPENANNIESITTTIEQHIAGNIGFSGIKPTAGLTGGVDITHQSSFSVQDVTVRNSAGSQVTNAAWSYTFKRPEQTPEYIFPLGTYGNLSAPALLAYSAFQPTNQWVWQVSSEFRSLRPVLAFSTNLTVNLENAWGGNPITPFNVTPSQIEFYSFKTGTFWARVPLIYPPLISAPLDMNFGSQGQFQTALLAATGQWTASCDQTWCHIDQASGVDSTNIHVTVDQNTTGAARSATINFTSPDGLNSDTTKVFQSQYQSL